MKNGFLLFLLVTFVLLFLIGDAEAQCAMCKATNESALDNGSTQGKGVNEAIVYLMFVPYLLLGLLGFFFFRKKLSGFFQEMKAIHK
jgi:amino acid transporter